MFHQRIAAVCIGLISILVSILILGQFDQQPHVYVPLIRGMVPRAATPSATSLATLSPTSTETAIPGLTPTPHPTTTPSPTAPLEQPCGNAYPLAIDTALLNETTFLPPENSSELSYYLPYTDTFLLNTWQRRIYVDETSARPGVHVLRWQADPTTGQTPALVAAFRNAGALATGFDEVTPWPDPSTTSPLGYPLLPHVFNASDWVHSAKASAFTPNVGSVLDHHIEQRSIMVLAIVDRRATVGNEPVYHVLRLGNFLLQGRHFAGGALTALDMVYVGSAVVPLCTAL